MIDRQSPNNSSNQHTSAAEPVTDGKNGTGDGPGSGRADIPIVIEERIWTKGRRWFEPVEYRWIRCADGESAVADAIRTSGARIAVLGSAPFKGPLYEALAAAAPSAGTATPPSAAAADGSAAPQALVARFGVGYDGIDRAACGRHNIALTITPGALDQSVAEHAVALMLAVARRVCESDAAVRRGDFPSLTGFDLAGRTLGVAGFGAIGRRVAWIAAQGLGMRVLAYDSLTTEQAAANWDNHTAAEFLSHFGVAGWYTDFAQFAPHCDIVSAHIPVLPTTQKFFSRDRFALFKPGSVFINTGRGRLVDEAALFDALSTGTLGGAGIDVFDGEPYAPTDPAKDLRRTTNTVLTSHIASDTVNANQNMANLVLHNIDRFVAGDYTAMKTIAPPR